MLGQVLNRGRSLGTFRKAEISREEVVAMMAGGEELEEPSDEFEEFARTDRLVAAQLSASAHDFAVEASELPRPPSGAD